MSSTLQEWSGDDELQKLVAYVEEPRQKDIYESENCLPFADARKLTQALRAKQEESAEFERRWLAVAKEVEAAEKALSLMADDRDKWMSDAV